MLPELETRKRDEGELERSGNRTQGEIQASIVYSAQLFETARRDENKYNASFSSHLYSAVGDVEESQLFYGGKRRETAYLFRPLFFFIFRATQQRDYVTIAFVLKRTNKHHYFLLLFFIAFFHFFAFFICLPVNELSRNRRNFINSPNRHLQRLIYRFSIRVQVSRFRFSSPVSLAVNIPPFTSMIDLSRSHISSI